MEVWVDNNNKAVKCADAICVVSLQNSPLVGNFWFAFYPLSYRTHQNEHLDENIMPIAPLFTEICDIKHDVLCINL